MREWRIPRLTATTGMPTREAMRNSGECSGRKKVALSPWLSIILILTVLAVSRAVVPGSGQARYYANGGFRWHLITGHDVELQSKSKRPFLVILDDGAVGCLDFSSRPGLFASVRFEDSAPGGPYRLVSDPQDTDGRVSAGHLWANAGYNVIHLQMRDYPIVLGPQAFGGVASDLPELVNNFFESKLEFIGFVLLGLQADCTVVANSDLAGFTMKAMQKSIHEAMSTLGTAWSIPSINLNRPAILVGLVGIGTKQLYVPEDKEGAAHSKRSGK